MNKHAPKGPIRPKAKKGTFGRVIKKLFGYYPVLAPITVVCILFAAVTSAIPAIFIQKVTAAIEKWYKIGDWAAASKEIVPTQEASWENDTSLKEWLKNICKSI